VGQSLTTQEAPKSNWNRSIVALIVCGFTSAMGAFILVTALGIQVYDLTHQEIHLGLLGLAEFAPSALLVLVTGTVADRYDRARVSAIAASFEALAGIGLAIYTASNGRSVLPIFGIVLIFGAARAFLAPANRAIPADIVSAEVLPWLTARRSTTWQAALIVGPVTGGMLYAIDPVLPYVVMSVLLVTAAVAMFFVNTERDSTRVAPEPTAPEAGDPLVDPAISHEVAPPRAGLREAFEGLRFIRRSPILLGAISLDLFAVLFGGAIALLPAIAEDRLGAGPVGLGWLRAAGGIGAAMTTLWLTRRPLQRKVGRTLLLVVAIFGVFTIVLGATRVYAIAFVAMAILSGADAISVFIRSTLVPLITPFDKRGRVLAVESVFIGASNELGAFESGVAGQLLGSSGAIVLGGAATLVIAGTYWVAFPGLRDVDGFPESGEQRRPIS
jgi:MFS family permease